MADFIRWRNEREQVKTIEQQANEMEERSENVTDKWKQLREKLRHYECLLKTENDKWVEGMK